MGKITKVLAAGFAAALLAGALAGCGSSSSASSASADASASGSASAAQTTDELIAEIEALQSANDFGSVTMNGTMDMNIDIQKLSEIAAESASAESASAEAASSEAAADTQTGMAITTAIKAEIDKSGEKSKMHMLMNAMNQEFELYVNGDDAVMVSGGEAYSGTLEELGMTQYGSGEDLMNAQGADISAYKDAIKSVEKTTEGDNTVYTIVADGAQFAASNPQLATTMSQLPEGISMGDVTIVMTADSQGRMVDVKESLEMTGLAIEGDFALSDFDSTTVPDAPEATKSISEMNGGAPTGATDVVEEGAAEASSAASAA